MSMKYFVMAAAMMTVLSTAALAADPAPSATPAASLSGMTDQEKQARIQQKFEKVKALRLQRVGNVIANAQQHQSCIQAAANFEALKSCKAAHKAKRQGEAQGTPEKR